MLQLRFRKNTFNRIGLLLAALDLLRVVRADLDAVVVPALAPLHGLVPKLVLLLALMFLARGFEDPRPRGVDFRERRRVRQVPAEELKGGSCTESRTEGLEYEIT